jgi:hypothetical protein
MRSAEFELSATEKLAERAPDGRNGCAPEGTTPVTALKPPFG